MTVKVTGRLECNDGAVLHEWALCGHGLAWRSLWEVDADLRAGRLVSVLDTFAAPATGIHAVFPQRKHLALRVRLLIDHLKNHYGRPGYWMQSDTGRWSRAAGCGRSRVGAGRRALKPFSFPLSVPAPGLF
jgi:hypothetical protein